MMCVLLYHRFLNKLWRDAVLLGFLYLLQYFSPYTPQQVSLVLHDDYNIVCEK